MDNILCCLMFKSGCQANYMDKRNKDIGLPCIPMIHSAIDLIWANDVPALYIHVTTS